MSYQLLIISHKVSPDDGWMLGLTFWLTSWDIPNGGIATFIERLEYPMAMLVTVALVRQNVVELTNPVTDKLPVIARPLICPFAVRYVSSMPGLLQNVPWYSSVILKVRGLIM